MVENLEYKNSAEKIKNYLDKNNLKDYTDEEKENLFKKFADTYSIDYLKQLSGKDILYKIFMDNKSFISLTYILEYSAEYSSIAGGIKGNYKNNYPLYISSKTNQWMTGKGNNTKSLSEEEAIIIATKIRDAIVEGAEFIDSFKSELTTVENYILLGKELEKIFKNCIAKSTYVWIHKYYVLLFPDIFPRIHNEKMKQGMLKKFEIKPLPDYYAKDGQLAILSKEAGIKLYSLFNEDIIELFYKWDKDIWEDFNPDNLISNRRGGNLGEKDKLMDVDKDGLFSNFYSYLIDKGYFFSKNVIENYLLSLKVKPFAILTGNSGTGKTKLSQLFAEYLSNSGYYMVDVTTKARSWCYSEKKGVEGSKCGWTLSTDDFRKVFPINEIEGNYEIEIGGYRTTADISFLPQLYYKKEYEEFKQHFKELYYLEKEQIKEDNKNNIKHIHQKVKLGISLDAITSAISNDYNKSNEISVNMNISEFSPVLLPLEIMEYIPLESTIPCEIMSGGYFAEGYLSLRFRIGNYKTNEIDKYLKSLKENNIKTFELKIFDFKPEIKDFKPIFDPIEYHHKKDDNNYVIVPVGANWTENRNVVGYYNVLTKSYQHTPSLDLLLNAEGKGKPYFLILDEMNLSHVERYFSDFLSAMESDKPIPLHKNSEEDKGEEVPEKIKIPENVFIIGTVNVDETTYMFSPKVLDRANVLEFKTFEDISINDYINNDFAEMEFKGDVDYLENPLSDVGLRDNILSEIDKDFKNVEYEKNFESVEYEDQIEEHEIIVRRVSVLEELTSELSQFNDYLKGSGFEFGYRTVNEILAFMLVSWKYEGGQETWNNWRRYFDAQILQKILPKLHGSQIVLEDTLDNLLCYCLDLDNLDDVPKLSEIDEKYPYPESAKKLIQMKDVLDKQTYVSFIN